MKPARRRELAHFLIEAYRVSRRRAARTVCIQRSSFDYRPHRPDDRVLRTRIREIAQTRVRYGCMRIQTLLRREGWRVNHKKTRRIYVEEGLNLRRMRPRLRVAAAHRLERPVLTGSDQYWSMVFVANSLFNGRQLRALTVFDNYSRECMAIAVDSG